MSSKQKSIVSSVVSVGVLLLGVLAFAVGRPRSLVDPGKKEAVPSVESHAVQTRSAKAGKPGPRNLSLQPEAFNMARRLGQRFSPSNRERSILVGTLTTGSEQRSVQTTRIQTDAGEQVEIKIAGSAAALTWDAGQGARTSAGRADGGDRELIERLVLDSPDQFVLAQLRGASYYTVGRNVRPIDADDNYAGPLWTVVRVEDPDPDSQKGPQSKVRFYYINSRTGFIDKVVSELHGDKIETLFEGWSQQDGETWPSRIVWIRQGTRLMELSVDSLKVNSAESEGAR